MQQHGKNLEQQAREQAKTFQQRLVWLQIGFAAIIVSFIIYLFANQVLDVRNYRVKAKNQRRASSFV